MNQVLRKGARKGSQTTMTNAETNDTAATVAAQGATVAPEKTSSKKAEERRYSGRDHALRFTLHLARMIRGILAYLPLPW